MAKILIVEDEGILAMTVRLYLTKIGHQVVGVADNGSRAIEIVRTEKPDVILMDIVLKGSLNGIETTGLICENVDCKVIYMTAHTDLKTVEAAKKTKHVGFLFKPFELAQLKELIDTLLLGNSA